MEKIILDIRLYKNEDLNNKTTDQKHHSTNLGLGPIAERFALKLNEQNFESGDWDHLYIYFTKLLSPGEIKLRDKGEKIASVLVGVSDNDMYIANQRELQDFQLRTIRNSFYFLSKKQPLDMENVDLVKKLIDTHGEQLEIVQKEKHSRSIHVIASYTVADQSRLYIYARDKDSEQQGKREITKLIEARDARTLASKLVVKGNEIQIHPRNSMKASWICDQYFQELYSSDKFIRVELKDLFSNYCLNNKINNW